MGLWGCFDLEEWGSGITWEWSLASGLVGVIGGWVRSGSIPPWGWGTKLWGRRGFRVSLAREGELYWVLPFIAQKGTFVYVINVFFL